MKTSIKKRSFPFRSLLAAAAIAALPGLALASPPEYQIGGPLNLTGEGYEHTSGGGIVREGIAISLNEAGQVSGHSRRYHTNGGLLGWDTWLYNDTGTQLINLTGTEYEYTHASGGVFRFGQSSDLLNEAGQVRGFSERYHTDGAFRGEDVWLYNGASTQLINLAGTEYEYNHASGGVFRYGISTGLNEAGQVSGASALYHTDGDYRGGDAWFYDGTSTQRINPTGTGYQYTPASGGVIRIGQPTGLNEAGQVSGSSVRLHTDGSFRGWDAWLYNGTSTQIINPTGTGYQYDHPGGEVFRHGESTGLNEAGQVIGYSGRYTVDGGERGRDVWLYDGASTQFINLTGTGYEYNHGGGGVARYGEPTGVDEAGRVRGYSLRYHTDGGGRGLDAWLYDGTSTQRINLTGTEYEYTHPGGGVFRNGLPIDVNEAGHIRGFSRRYHTDGGGRGEDAWLYDGTSTQRINLTGTDYEYDHVSGGVFRIGASTGLNEAGQVIGYSERYRFGGAYRGRDAWFYDGTSTQLINLTGPGYQYVHPEFEVHRFSQPAGLNEAGQVIGTSNRYHSDGSFLGRAGWFFDALTGDITALEFSFRSSDNHSLTTPSVLTETGVVLGSYTLYDDATSLGERAFWWHLDDGFFDLGELVEGGLDDAGWQYLASVYGMMTPGAAGLFEDGLSPFYILGTGRTIGMTGGQDVYRVAIPEPASLSLLALGGLALLRRRRNYKTCNLKDFQR